MSAFIVCIVEGAASFGAVGNVPGRDICVLSSSGIGGAAQPTNKTSMIN